MDTCLSWDASVSKFEEVAVQDSVLPPWSSNFGFHTTHTVASMTWMQSSLPLFVRKMASNIDIFRNSAWFSLFRWFSVCLTTDTIQPFPQIIGMSLCTTLRSIAVTFYHSAIMRPRAIVFQGPYGSVNHFHCPYSWGDVAICQRLVIFLTLSLQKTAPRE